MCDWNSMVNGICNTVAVCAPAVESFHNKSAFLERYNSNLAFASIYPRTNLVRIRCVLFSIFPV